MNKTRVLMALSLVVFLAVSLTIPYVSGKTPPYIQAGLRFIYQLYNGETQQPENAYHSYIIKSITSQRISIRIDSDIVKSVDLDVDEDGNILGGKGRVDLWIPPDLPVGQTLSILGYDAVIIQKNYDVDKSGKLTFTIVASTDQTIFWLYVDGGSSNEAKQLIGLLYAMMFPNSKKLLVLVNIEQTQPSTVTTRATSVSKVTKSSTQIETRQGVTTTQIVITEEVTTVTHTVITTMASTITVERTVTYQTELASASTPSFIPLPVAIAASVAIIGGGFFFIRARRRPLPPTYPYPYSPTQSLQYIEQHPAPYTTPPPQQIVGLCPACGYPIYAGDKDCRRCNYRIA